MRLKSALPNGSSSARMKSHIYYGVPLSPPYSPTRLFAQSPSVIVQLVNPDGFCLESEFATDGTSANTVNGFSVPSTDIRRLYVDAHSQPRALYISTGDGLVIYRGQ